MTSPEPKARDPVAVSEMFGAIAHRYDLANHILSCGFDFLWRRRAASIVADWKPKHILDLASGTGDLALLMQKRWPEAEVTGSDFSNEMLAIARRKGVRQTEHADIEALPFADQSCDCITIAFGLRNVHRWDVGLQEMHRVLRPGGHLLILDFSLPANVILRALYRFYLHRFVPLIASVVTGNQSAYEYLGGSIEEFPSGNAMRNLIEGTGFAQVDAQPLTGGIVTIYTAAKK